MTTKKTQDLLEWAGYDLKIYESLELSRRISISTQLRKYGRIKNPIDLDPFINWYVQGIKHKNL